MFCCTRFCHLFDHVANEIVIVSLIDGYIECLVYLSLMCLLDEDVVGFVNVYRGGVVFLVHD